jgi:hypothetical protein
MYTETFSYQDSTGWSVAALPSLDSEATLVLAFGGAHATSNDPAISALRSAYPQSVIAGCSTAGRFTGSTLTDSGVCVSVTRFDKTRLRTVGTGVRSAEESNEAAQRLARELLAPDLRFVLVFSDGLQVNGSELVRGFESVLPETVGISGGLAADEDRFESTWVISDGSVLNHRITAIGFYGTHLNARVGSQGGWDIFGIERRVTKSRGNVLYELDGKPALALYKSYLGDLAKELPASAYFFPLAVRKDTAQPQALVRTVVAVSEEEQSMTFAGDIPEGHLAQMMKGSVDRLVDGATYCARSALPTSATQDPPLLITVSCMGRRMVMRQRSEEELEAILEEFPPGTQQIGFYSYGEIAPSAMARCDFHNQSISLTALYEL